MWFGRSVREKNPSFKCYGMHGKWRDGSMCEATFKTFGLLREKKRQAQLFTTTVAVQRCSSLEILGRGFCRFTSLCWSWRSITKMLLGKKAGCSRGQPCTNHSFPVPHRYKDGKPLPVNHTFQPDPLRYKLTILDVNVKHAGNYTFALSNTKHGLYRNLTIQLIVHGELLASGIHATNPGSCLYYVRKKFKARTQ